MDRTIYLRMFSAGLFLLLREHLVPIEHITIDPEYPGWEAEVKGMLLRYVRGIYPGWSKEKIVFGRIGKKSPAHEEALQVYRGEKLPGRKIGLGEFLALL